jgi:hypothetical protein
LTANKLFLQQKSSIFDKLILTLKRLYSILPHPINFTSNTHLYLTNFPIKKKRTRKNNGNNQHYNLNDHKKNGNG